MLKLKKILLFFSIMIFLISPAYAWEQSFEGHSKDDPLSTISFSATTTAFHIDTAPNEHGTCYNWYSMGSTSAPGEYIQFAEPFNGYFSFSTKNGNPIANYQWTMTVAFVDTSGTQYYTSTYHESIYGTTETTWHRYEYIQSGNALNIYKDGNLVKTDNLGTNTPSKIRVYFYSNNYGGKAYIDDFSSNPNIVSCDPSAIPTDVGQYYRVGAEFGSTSGNSTFYTKTYSPSGNVLRQDISNNSEEKLIPVSFMNESGTYLIKLYQQSGSSSFPMASRFFDFDINNADKVVIDKTDYKPGDTITINTFAKAYTGYFVEVPYFDSEGKTQVYKYTMTAEDQTKYFTIPSTARGGSHIIGLYNANGAIRDGVQYNCLASGGLTSLTIDKAVYAPGDTVKIKYASMPANTQISIKVQKGNSVLATNTFTGISGSGVVTYQLTQSGADNFIVNAFSGTVSLGQLTGTIIGGTYFLSGRIINPSDGSLIPGASITISTSSTTSDINGAFNLSTSAGWQDLTITKTGYQANINKVNIVYPTAKQDFYLVSNYSGSGHSIYGIVSDYYTGAPVSSAYISLKQGAVTHNLFSYTGSGYYLFDSEDMTGAWVMTVTKTGYYTYTKTITLTGDTYQQVLMTPTKYSSTGDTGSSNDGSGSDGSGSGGSGSGGSGSGGSGSSGSGSSGSGSSSDPSVIDDTGVSQDRPGREAAKGTMEQFEGIIPSMFGLVIFKVIMELLK